MSSNANVDAVKENESKYRTIFENTGTGMMLIEEDMTISLTNQKLVEFSGYSHEEVEGNRKWFEFVHEDDRVRLMEYYAKRDRGEISEVPSEYEFRYLHKNGNVRDMLINVGMIPGTNRRLVSLVDITERKQMERALRASERRYRDLFEKATDIIYTHDLDGHLTSVNAAGMQLYGYTQEEIENANIFDIVDSSYADIVRRKIQAKIESRESGTPYEVLTYTKAGKKVWIEVSTRLVTNAEGKVEVQGIARDVTARKKTEQELRESRRVIEDTNAYMPAIICESDSDLKLTFVNKAGLATFGYSEEEVKKGIKILDLVHPDDRDNLIRDFENIQKGDFGNFVEHRFVKNDGTVANLIVNSTPIIREGEFAGLRSYVVDITDRRLAEERLRESEECLRSMVEASPIGISMFTPTGLLRDMNDSFRRMFGLGAEAKPEDVPFSLFESMKEFASKAKGLREGKGFVIETDTDLKFIPDGDSLTLARAGRRYLQWHVTPFGTGEGDGIRFFAQVEDVTERKRAEEARLKVVQDEADKANRQLENLRKEMGQRSAFHNMVSRSENMQKIFDLLPEVSQASTTVLITGESGTGKELIAKSIHEVGPRKDKPFVAINCSALPDNLLESELFGYKAGAFTDAKKDKPGKFALADGGTIFLDEIGDISTAMQVKLLRVLQERIFEPLGATKSVSVDVRVVAATNKDLSQMVRDKEFREDLYYRIKVLSIELPPLRERRSDIPLLCDHFIRIYNARFGKEIKEVSSAALDRLLAHDYPGNIRELENIIEHAFIFCKSASIEPEHLPSEMSATGVDQTADPFMGARTFEDLERVFIRKTLQDCGGNKVEAAKLLGVHKATLFRKIKALGLGESVDRG